MQQRVEINGWNGALYVKQYPSVSTADDQPEKVSAPRMQSVSYQEERGICWRRRVADNGCVYETVVAGWRGLERRGASLSLDWSCQRLGGDTDIQNCKPAQAKGALYSFGGVGEGKKGKLGAKL